MFDSVLHGVNVASHIVFSILLTGLGVALADPAIVGKFASYVGHYGVPIAIVNIVVAAVLKYIKSVPDTTVVPNAPQ